MRRYRNKIKFIYNLSFDNTNFFLLIRIIVLNKIFFLLKAKQLRACVCSVRIKLNHEEKKIYLRYSDVPTLFEIFYTRPYDYKFELPDRPTILDLGGHIGLATIFLSSKFKPYKSLVLEPEEENFSLLKKNLPDAIVINKAISTKEGTVFLINSEHSVNHKIGKKGHLVQSVDILQLIKEYAIKEIDLLKIDIEGHEKEILQDAGPWILYVRNIVMEIHNDITEDFVKRLLRPYGFIVELYQKDILIATRKY